MITGAGGVTLEHASQEVDGPLSGNRCAIVLMHDAYVLPALFLELSLRPTLCILATLSGRWYSDVATRCIPAVGIRTRRYTQGEERLAVCRKALRRAGCAVTGEKRCQPCTMQ